MWGMEGLLESRFFTERSNRGYYRIVYRGLWPIHPDPELVGSGQEFRGRPVPLGVEAAYPQHPHPSGIHRVESPDQNLVVGRAQYDGNSMELVMPWVEYVAAHGWVPASTDSPQ